MRAGTVVALAARGTGGTGGRTLLAAGRLQAVAGLGILGDAHADSLSPRQLLLACASVYRDLSLPQLALRENLLLDIDTAGLASGSVLAVGPEVRLRMMFQCEACGQLDLVQPRLAARIGGRRGMLARVLAGGEIRPGDAVRDLGMLEAPWHDDWRERVRRVLDAVPGGMVVEYRQLARLAGIQSSYCRAFPRLLGKLGASHAARAVPARSDAALPRWDGAGLFDAASEAGA